MEPSAAPLVAPVTSRPEFIVPMVLLAVVVLAGTLAGLLYLKHQKR